MSASYTNQARETFKKYGFIPSNSFKYRGVLFFVLKIVYI